MSTKYITLSTDLIKDKNLSINQKFILAEIMQLTIIRVGCMASNAHFAHLIGITIEEVLEAIENLIADDYISCTHTLGTTDEYERVLRVVL